MRGKGEHDTGSLIHELSFRPHDRMARFLRLPLAKRASVLPQLSRHIARDVLTQLPDDALLAVLEQLDPNGGRGGARLLPAIRQKKIVARLSRSLCEDVEFLCGFDPDTAAGIMKLDYVLVEEAAKIAEAARHVREHEARTGRLPVIVAMRDGKVVGYLPGHAFGLSRPSETLKTHMRHVPVVNHDANHAEVVETFRRHPHSSIVVLGSRKQVVGIIYSDDVLRLMEESRSASLYDFAGVHDEESVTDSIRTKVRFRYKWLIINLGTAFLASATVSLFDETISKFVLLAVYMPIVAGMGGNAATQTLAVLVRGIALKQIDLKTASSTLRHELGAGLFNGIINGVLVAAVVFIVNRDIKIAFILGLAMITNLVVAAFFGTLVPLMMKKFGKDPATSATIFITTATDVLGFLFFLG